MRNQENKPASASGDFQLAEEDFIRCFYQLLQVPKIHGAENQLAIRAAKAFIHTGGRLFSELDEIFLEARQGRLFLSGEKLLMRRHTAVCIFGILSVFESLMIDGLKFNRRLTNVSHAEAYAFARRLLEARQLEKPAERLSGLLAESGVGFAEIVSAIEDQSRTSPAHKVRQAFRLYSFAYNSIKQLSGAIFENRRPGIRKPLRVIQDLTDFAIRDASVLLGIATIRDYDDYTYTHSVNVAVLSICLGQRIGLSRQSLVFLGICAMFHDLGKIDIPMSVIAKPGPLNRDEFRLIRQHPLNSVRQVLKLQAGSDLVARIILGPFEHHLRYDRTGYPEVNWKRPVSLFGRIIEICDVYDALTSPRSYRAVPFSPGGALGRIGAGAGTDFDPLLVKWFINMVGAYPAGSVVVLDTGETGLVCEGGFSGTSCRPSVLVLKKGKTGRYFPSKRLDLNACDPVTGRLPGIKSTHHASEFGIQPAMLLMAAEHAKTRKTGPDYNRV